jgi:acetyl esterase/lipase
VKGYLLKAYLVKAYTNIMEPLARVLLLNRKFPKGSVAHKNIHFSEYGTLDIFTPENPDGKYPVLIYIHGGGWITGSRRSCRRICAVISREGYVVLNLKYRLSPRYKHPDALNDIADAVDWLYENAGKFKADTGRILFGGSSAGAHLASMTACIATNENLRKQTGVKLNIERNQLRGTILVYGGFNMKTILDSGFLMIKTMVRAYTGNAAPGDAIWNQISPIDHITKEFPPAYITAGERDHLYGQSLELVKVLNDYGILHEKLLFGWDVRDAGHGFFHFYNRDCTKQAYKGIIRFMKEHSGDNDGVSSDK